MGFCNHTILFVLLFMLNTSLMNHVCICKASDQDLCISSERQTLLNFKRHLVDPLNMLVSWSENTNCCNWTSVICNNVSGHILQLHLRTSRSDDYFEYETYERSQFRGEIGPSILSLNYLSYLDLSGNDFWGMQIPSFLGSMKSLTYLNLSDAGFSGSIPHQIGNLFNLLHLDLGGLIMSIDLSDNKLSGEIPSQITSLAGLQFLNFSNNLLHGKIPQRIGNMGSLQSIDFSENELSGEIPPSISKLNFLNKLNLSHNNLTGKIPTGTQLQSFEADSFVGNDLWSSTTQQLQ